MLGGFLGVDRVKPGGYIVSAGMLGLASQLKQRYPDATIQTQRWANYRDVGDDMEQHPQAINVIVGYSGGVSRASWLVNERPKLVVDLLVGYDPSPAVQMRPIKNTGVIAAVCYFNKTPFFFGYGGGELIGPQVVVYPISESHITVQFDQKLHTRTMLEIDKAVARARIADH